MSCRQFIPVPQRLSGVTSFDTAVKIVPVVKQPQFQRRLLIDSQTIDWLFSLQQAQKVERAVERADVGC